MKKHLISLLALALAVLSLAMTVFVFHSADASQQALEAEILEQSQRIDWLYSKIDTLTAQLETLESGTEGTGSPICNFLVESWAADGETVTLTHAYAELQLPDGLTVDSAQLTLRHNGTEVSGAALTLEAAAEGVYRQTLTDTWFLLPDREDDNTLELYLDVVLSDGTALSALGVTWYCMDGGLYSAVG